MDLPHLKLAKTGNAKYRRRITSPEMRVMLGRSAVEWSLKTRDPVKIVDAWKVAHAKFEALQVKAEGTQIDQIEWSIAHTAAVAHGLAGPETSKIGPIDSEMEGGRFNAFTNAALAEAAKLTPQSLNAPLANNPPTTAFDQLLKAQLFGVQRPPILLSVIVEAYLKDRERRSSYADLAKQVKLVVDGLQEVMGRVDPPIQTINRETAYAFRDRLTAKGNAQGTVRRRITTIKAILNHGEKRFDLPDWRNPFNGLEMAQDDDAAGETKRDPLTLGDICKVRDHHGSLNEDARDIWHLMMFTGMGPNEARGLQWDEVHLVDATPHFEIKPNGRRRLKVGERRRRVPLVGTALTMMQRRRESALAGASDVFPRYASQRSANTLSATLVKSMKAAGVWVKIRKVPYSLRHSVKDWLRRTAPTNMQLLIMGHGHGEGRAAGGYGGDDLLDMQGQHLEAALKAGGVISYPVVVERKL
jgi:integrase